MSPLLLNLYSECIFEEALTDGIKINGQIQNNLRYVDLTAIIADSPETVQRLLNRLTQVGDQYCLKINTIKTKILIIPKNPETPIITNIYGKKIEVVKIFKYLRS